MKKPIVFYPFNGLWYVAGRATGYPTRAQAEKAWERTRLDDELRIRVNKGTREVLVQIAAEKGKRLSDYLRELIEREIREREDK